MATEIIRRLDWCINNYFTQCTYYSSRDETKIFVSPRGECMAMIEYYAFKQDAINIYIKTNHYANLNTVTLYNKQPETCFVGGSKEIGEKYIIKIFGMSTDWCLLKTIRQFPKSGSDHLHLSFEFTFKKHDFPCLATDISSHLMDPTFSDVTIRTSEGDELPAHKILLVARSRVFRALFQHDTAEKATNIVECPFRTNVVKHLLAFIYQNMVADIEETALDLLVAADYYQMDRLKELCEDVLIEKLYVNNAIELLTLADKHHACNLKKKALEFIKLKKDFVKIDWESLSKELIQSIFEFAFSNL